MAVLRSLAPALLLSVSLLPAALAQGEAPVLVRKKVEIRNDGHYENGRPGLSQETIDLTEGRMHQTVWQKDGQGRRVLDIESTITFDVPPAVLRPGQELVLNASGTMTVSTDIKRINITASLSFEMTRNYGVPFSGETRLVLERYGKTEASIEARTTIDHKAAGGIEIAVKCSRGLSIVWTYELEQEQEAAEREVTPEERNDPPVILSADVTQPQRPTIYDESFRVSVAANDPNQDDLPHLTVRYEVESYRKSYRVEPRSMRWNRSKGQAEDVLEVPISGRSALTIKIVVSDGEEETVGTLKVPIAVPIALIRTMRGQVKFKRYYPQVEGLNRGWELFTGDVVTVGGGVDPVSSIDIEWKYHHARGRAEVDMRERRATGAFSASFTMGATRYISGWPATNLGEPFEPIVDEWLGNLNEALLTKGSDEAWGRGVSFVLQRTPALVGRATGLFVNAGAYVGGSNTNYGPMTRINLNSLVILEGSDDGSVRISTLEGAPSLQTKESEPQDLDPGKSAVIGGEAGFSPGPDFDPRQRLAQLRAHIEETDSIPERIPPDETSPRRLLDGGLIKHWQSTTLGAEGQPEEAVSDGDAAVLILLADGTAAMVGDGTLTGTWTMDANQPRITIRLDVKDDDPVVRVLEVLELSETKLRVKFDDGHGLKTGTFQAR